MTIIYTAYSTGTGPSPLQRFRHSVSANHNGYVPTPLDLEAHGRLRGILWY